MKAMIFSDLISSRGSLFQLLVISLFVSVFIAFTSGQLVTVVGCIAAMVPFMYLFSITVYDEQNGWERFRLTMPISRKQVAFGRYTSFLIVVVISATIGTLTAIIAGSIAQLLPDGMVSNLVRLDAWSIPELLAAGLLVSIVILVAAAFSLPVVMRFGMTKAVRFVPVIIVLALAVGVGLFGNNPNMLHLDQILASSEGTTFLLIALTATTLVLYCASAVLSAQLYKKREL